MSKWNSKPLTTWDALTDAARFLVSDEARPEGQRDRNITRLELALGILSVANIAKGNQAAANPTVTDDSADGYAVGSRWLNTETDEEFVCTDATAGAAVWKSTTAVPALERYHDLAGYYPGVLAASGIVLYFVSVRAMTILAASPGRARARTAATASTTFTIQKNGVSVGTFTFATGATSATFTVSADIVLADGDTLSVLGDSTADTALADVAVSLKATAT